MPDGTSTHENIPPGYRLLRRTEVIRGGQYVHLVATAGETAGRVGVPVYRMPRTLYRLLRDIEAGRPVDWLPVVRERRQGERRFGVCGPLPGAGEQRSGQERRGKNNTEGSW